MGNTSSSPKAPKFWIKGIPLGQGGFGTVYFACDFEKLRWLAVKQVDVRSITHETSEKIKALQTEIEILSTLHHERIVQYCGWYKDDATLSIFMELMTGSVKDEINARGAITEMVTRKYTWQILEGLIYLHDCHIMHRDIKGANVLIDSSGNVKLGDFGIAKCLQTIVTSSGHTIIGTLGWMSPEVSAGQSYGIRADIWSLGCTVVEMLTTKPPPLPQPINFSLLLNTSQVVRNFLSSIFVDEEQRPYARNLINHPWFSSNYF